MTGEVLCEINDKVAKVTINRAAKMNSMNPPFMAELSGVLRELDDNNDVSVIILTADGPHFGAGYDLKYNWVETYGRGPMGTRKMLKDCADFEYGPWDCSKPVIAMVRGYCLAGSCELAMMCCITYASEEAMFGEPEIRFSTAPPAVIMPWIIGLKRTRELLYTGDMITAEEARQFGMVNKVFSADKLEEETMRYAKRASAISLEGLQTTKAAINQGAEIAGLRSAITYGVEVGGILDAQETEQYKQFEAVKKEKGLGAPIRWRETQFE
ncbi:MAG: enoyl-CoA hydratase/isomerase family protein [Rhodospirillaceae bacterium]|nr:enoyl-CoA hydratase/isomerase family protein [Rhodospirillaceae bacterium]